MSNNLKKWLKEKQELTAEIRRLETRLRCMSDGWQKKLEANSAYAGMMNFLRLRGGNEISLSKRDSVEYEQLRVVYEDKNAEAIVTTGRYCERMAELCALKQQLSQLAFMLKADGCVQKSQSIESRLTEEELLKQT